MGRPEFRSLQQQAAQLRPQVAPFVLRYLDRWRPYKAAWNDEDGWDESRAERWADPDSGRSANVWGRAMGWYVMALVDCIEALSGFAPAQTAARVLTTALRTSVDALLAVRTPEGLWLQLPVLPKQPGNYPEASASLMIACALLKGGRLGLLEAGAAEAGQRALAACIDTFLDERELGGICGVAGLGNTPYRDGSVACYLSEPVVGNDPKGVAALLLAVAEALRR